MPPEKNGQREENLQLGFQNVGEDFSFHGKLLFDPIEQLVHFCDGQHGSRGGSETRPEVGCRSTETGCHRRQVDGSCKKPFEWLGNMHGEICQPTAR